MSRPNESKPCDHNNPCKLVLQLEERVNNLAKAVTETQNAIADIRDKLLNRLPWPAVTLITVLSSLSVGLIVFALKR